MKELSRTLVRKDPLGFEVFAVVTETSFRAEPVDESPADKELIDAINSKDGEVVTTIECCNENGNYVGNEETAKFLYSAGIVPEIAQPDNKVCSIGFCESEQKWYGWSHRAIHGFAIGDTAKAGDCCTTPGSIPEHIEKHPEADLSVPVGFVAKSLDDCKRMAIAFADSVG